MCLSVCPSICGWNAVLSCRSMRKEYMRFAHNRKVKSNPRLDIIAEGIPRNRMTSRVMTSANSLGVMSERQCMRWHILESFSTTTRIPSYVPSYATLSDIPVRKSMEKTSRALVWIRRGWSYPPTNHSSSLTNQAGSTVRVYLFVHVGPEVFMGKSILHFHCSHVTSKGIIMIFLQDFHPKSLNLGYVQYGSFVEKLSALRPVTEVDI